MSKRDEAGRGHDEILRAIADRAREKGGAVSAVFAGPDKHAMIDAAEVLARELGRELYRVDLAQVVSKYIGETEKNLERLFHRAEDGAWVLFFDDAEALFGDRSGNEALVHRIVAYAGVVILAVDLRKVRDRAFERHVHFVVEFPGYAGSSPFGAT